MKQPERFMKLTVRLAALLAFALITITSLAQTTPPVIVNSVGYINGTSQTVHTSSAFNSSGASTLVAFVSTNTPWNGQPVSLNGVSDNLGNTWSALTVPTVFSGSTWTLLSAIYYVNNPVTSANQTVTVQLSNPAPLVFHVFAVSGSDVTGPPIVSPITDPGTGATSANVASAPISIPNNSLLLSWVKNETGASATALNGYTLDGQSTSFLWAESQTAISSGSYSGAFQYSFAIGWQTAIVGLKPSTAPVASNQTVFTAQDTPVNITLTATSPQGYPLTYTVLTQPTQGSLSGSAPNLTYTPNPGYTGPDSFTFRANDGVSNSNTATVSISVHGLAPVIDSTVGYINGTPLAAHTSSTFNSTGASTLVAFVSSHPSWNGLPVSLSGLTDNVGNTWTRLTGPTQFVGSTYTLMSSIYYVNSPATSPSHTVTAQLTNPAPLVLHVFAVSQSDTGGAPIFSPITDPGTGGASATVTSAPITVPINSLLLGWVKNETSATATAVNGYALDSQSTSFLWAESQTPISAGSYTGNFQYGSSIGWQTAIVGIRPHSTAPPAPVITSQPTSPINQTSASFSFSDTQTGVSFLCQLDGNGFSTCSSPATYSGLIQGSHTFSVKAQDTGGNQSGATNVTWTIDTTAPPSPVITSTPANPTAQTTASFSFSDTEAGVSFLCQLDTGAFLACTSPKSYSGLSQGTHTFAVKAQDAAGNQSAAASFSWTIDTTPPPQPAITSMPANPTNQTTASFSFSDTQADVSFLCQLDTSVFSACTSPKSYSSLSQGTHTFAVKAQDAAGNQSSPATFSWSIDTTAPPKPVITSAPPSTTSQTSASFSFTDAQAGVTFLCQLDNSPFAVCTSPVSYAGPLSTGKHTFTVRAKDAAGNVSGNTSHKWTII
ncbi:MAG: Ig-like domain-containing protein [Acidobacteriota bacterium]